MARSRRLTSRQAWVAGVIACIVVVGTAPVASAASSSGAVRAADSTSSWPPSDTVLHRVDPGSARLVGLSCTSKSFCLGLEQITYSTSDVLSTITFNGTTWSKPVAVPAAFDLGDLSCGSPTFCLSTSVLGIYEWRGTQWAQVDKSGISEGDGVSCVSGSFCMLAVNGDKFQTWESGSFGKVVEAPNVTTQVSFPSCDSASLCGDVDQAGDLLTWRSGTWSNDPGLAGGPGDVSCADDDCVADTQSGLYLFSDGSWSFEGAQPDQYPDEIACIGAADCLIQMTNGVLDDWTPTTGFLDVSGATNLYGAQLSCALSDNYCTSASESWAIFAGTGAMGWQEISAPRPSFALVAASCASQTSCYAVDDDGWLFSWNGLSWSETKQIDPAAPVNDLSCATPANCVATDDAGDAVVESNGTWSAPSPLVDGPPATSPATSCASDGLCMAVIGDQAFYRTLPADSSWTAVSNTLANPSSAVSCTAQGWCMAVEQEPSGAGVQEQSFRLADASSGWGHPVSLPGNSDPSLMGPQSLACYSSSLCVAVDNLDVDQWNGSSWSTKETFSGAEAYGVGTACPSPSFCAVVATAASTTSVAPEATIYDGTDWFTPGDFPSNLADDAPEALACSPDEACQILSGDNALFVPSTTAANLSVAPQYLIGHGPVSGDIASFSVTTGTAATATGAAEIGWGDGKQSAGEVVHSGSDYGGTVEASHSYSAPGIYHVSVGVSQGGGTGQGTSYALVTPPSCVLSTLSAPKPSGGGPSAANLAKNFSQDLNNANKLSNDVKALGKEAADSTYTTSLFKDLGANDIAVLAGADLRSTAQVLGDNTHQALTNLFEPFDEAWATATGQLSAGQLSDVNKALRGSAGVDGEIAFANLLDASGYATPFLVDAGLAAAAALQRGGDRPSTGRLPELITRDPNTYNDPAVADIDQVACDGPAAVHLAESAPAAVLVGQKADFEYEDAPARLITAISTANVSSSDRLSALENLWAVPTEQDNVGYSHLAVALLASIAQNPAALCQKDKAGYCHAPGPGSAVENAEDFIVTNSNYSANLLALDAMTTVDDDYLARQLLAITPPASDYSSGTLTFASHGSGADAAYQAFVQGDLQTWASQAGSLYGLTDLPSLETPGCVAQDENNSTLWETYGLGVVLAAVALAPPTALAAIVGVAFATVLPQAESAFDSWDSDPNDVVDNTEKAYLSAIQVTLIGDMAAVGVVPPPPSGTSLADYLAGIATTSTVNDAEYPDYQEWVSNYSPETPSAVGDVRDKATGMTGALGEWPVKAIECKK